MPYLWPNKHIQKGQRHFLHDCPAFGGDSGGAIVISRGQVVGIHLESVNEFQKTLDMNALELASVADSVEDLIHSHHSGSVALFPSAMKPEQPHRTLGSGKFDCRTPPIIVCAMVECSLTSSGENQ